MRGPSTLRTKQHRAEARIAIGFAAVLSLLIAGVFAAEMRRTYNETIAVGRTRASNLALVLEEQTRRSVQTIDLALLGIVNRLREAPETPSHDAALTQAFRAQLANLPYVRAFFVVGADGLLIQDSDIGTPNVSLADRDYFKVHVNGPDPALYIGLPLKSRSTQIGSPWFLSISRRITRADGRFYGVAVAALEPKYFTHFYRNIDVGAGGVVGLIHRSGTVIARYPERGVGLSLADHKLFTVELPKAGAGTYFDLSKVDGTERLYGYRTVAPFPLVVAVGLSKAVLLAAWRSQAVLAGAAAAAVILVVIFGTTLMLRRRARDLALAEHREDIERIESLGRITSSVAHDFNNLLTIIGGNLEIVDRRVSDGDRSKKQLSAALKAVERGDRMIAQLLAVARREPIVRRAENISERAGGTVELLQQAARPCELRLEAPAETLYCEIDRSEFERALMNLVVNARDATKQGGAITVSVGAVPLEAFDRRKWPDLTPKDYVACRVQDHGQGIAPEVRRRVFEPFFTTKPIGLGTGLGLSQVFGFARRAGGSVAVESTIGVGTNVVIMLPRVQSATAETQPSVAVGAADDTSSIETVG
jgi:two-component system, NtrC family, sensor kinase